MADDEFPEERESRGFVTEFVRKAAVAGLGAVFMGEESLRGLAGQLKLPKEALGFLLSQAEKTKDEFSRIVSEELRRFLQSERLKDEFLKLLAGMTLEVTAQVRLVPAKTEAGESLTPQVTVNDVQTRRRKKKD